MLLNAFLMDLSQYEGHVDSAMAWPESALTQVGIPQKQSY